MLVLNTILGGGDASVSVPPTSLHELDLLSDIKVSPKDISVTAATDTCAGAAPTTISDGNTLTISGTDLASDGSGSCTVRTEGFSEGDSYSGSIANMSCDSFSGGSATGYATMDGNIGMSATITEASNSFIISAAIGSTDLLMGFIEDGSTKICEVKMIVYENVEISVYDDYATSSSQLSGCLSVCGTSYDVSGTETQTVTF